MVGGDRLRHVDQHHMLVLDEDIVGREVAVNQLGLPSHSADLDHELLVERRRVLDRDVHEARRRDPLRTSDEFHDENVPEMAVRTRDAHPGVGETTEDRMLPTGPGEDKSTEIPHAGLASQRLQCVRGKMAEDAVPDAIDLHRPEFRAEGRPEDPAFLPGRDRVVDGVELAPVHEARHREERRVVEELVEELSVLTLLAPVLEALAAARKDHVVRSRHRSGEGGRPLLGSRAARTARAGALPGAGPLVSFR